MRFTAAVIALSLILTACGSQEDSMPEPDPQPDNSLLQVITGEVWYRERMALAPGTEVVMTLEDQSRADAPATVITDFTHTVADNQAPFSFRLVYDPAAIDERMSYGLRARITRDGELLFTSTERIDPFAIEPGEPVRIMVSRSGD